MFSENGELIGFQIRENLLFKKLKNSKFNIEIVKKLTKTCIFLNRMLQFSEIDDFNLF